MARAILGMILALASTVCRAENYSDIWWNPAESGWGLTIADHQTNLFAVWYTYGADGRPVWYTIPGGTFSNDRRTFSGDMYVTRGPSYTLATFDPSQVVATRVGSASFDFAPSGQPAGSVLFSYNVNGVTRSSRVERMSFGNAAPQWGADFTDLWFNPAESGWGLALAQHGNNVFGVWYAYGTDGQPVWFALPGVQFTSPTTFSGKLYSTTGPYYGNASFDASAVRTTEAGSVSLRIDLGARGTAAQCDAGSALFAPVVDGPAANAPYQRSACTQAFGSARPASGNVSAQPKTCSGTFTLVATQPSGCMDYGMRQTFNGTIALKGIDWTRAGRQTGTITFTDLPYYYLPMMDGGMMDDMMMGMSNVPSCTMQVLPSLTLPVDFTLASAVQQMSTSGSIATDAGRLAYDLAVTASSVSGHVSYTGGGYATQPFTESGGFSCKVD